MSVFRRSSVHYDRTPEPETPYQRAAQAWDDRIGSARVQAKNWRLMAFGSLILSCGLAGGLVWQSTHGTVVPWVVQVDKLGEAQAVAPAVTDYRPSDPQIAWYLAHFIAMVRSLPDDPIIVRENWLKAYDFTTTAGAMALNDYARANDPFASLGKQQVAIDVSSGFARIHSASTSTLSIGRRSWDNDPAVFSKCRRSGFTSLHHSSKPESQRYAFP